MVENEPGDGLLAATEAPSPYSVSDSLRSLPFGGIGRPERMRGQRNATPGLRTVYNLDASTLPGESPKVSRLE